jgi:hypothetical protein
MDARDAGAAAAGDGLTGRELLEQSPQWMRRSFRGYRTSDVLAVVSQLAASLDREWRDRQRLEQELERVRAELTALLQEERARRLEAEQLGRLEAARLLAEAEEQAGRLRHEASIRVGDAAQRLEEVLRVREQLLGELRGIVQAYADVLERAEQGRIAPVVPPPPGLSAAATLPAAAATASVAGLAAAGGSGLFPRLVRLDAGPFSDFAELAAFERSLADLPKVEDVHVRHFGNERAEIELTLTEETPLVHDLDTHLPYRVTTTPIDHNHLTVDVEGVA